MFRAIFSLSLLVIFSVSLTSYFFSIETSANSIEENDFSNLISLQEKKFLDSLGPVKMVVNPNWYPYELITEKGDFIGIAADLINLISKRANIELELVKTEHWDESIETIKNNNAHIVCFLNKTKKRESYLIFTNPYFSDPNVFITRKDFDYIYDPARLTDKTVVLPKGTSVQERLKNDYPNLNIITVETEEEGFEKVSKKEADMALGSLSMALYTIRKEGLFNLKISGQIQEFENHFRVGVNKEYPMLAEILNKSISTISAKEVQDAVNRYIPIKIEKRANYRMFIKITTLLLVMIAAISFWVYKLKSLSKKLQVNVSMCQLAEKEIITQRNRFKMIIDTMTALIFLKDSQGKYILVNKSFANALGLNEQDIIGKKDNAFNATSKFADNYKSDDQKVLTENKSVFIPEEKLVKKDGSIGWFQTTKIPYIYQESDLVGVLGISIDITDYKRLKEEALVSSEKYKILVENANDIIYSLNKDGDLTYISPNWTEVLGHSQDEVLGKSIADFTHPDDVVKCMNFLKKVIETKQKQGGVQYRVKHKNGQWCWHTSNASPILDENGNFASYIGIARDITENKRIEQEGNYQKRFLFLIAEISSHFLNATMENIDDKFNKMLEDAAIFFNVDRAYIFQYSPDGQFFTNTHEWCGKYIPPVKDLMQNLSFNDFPWWSQIMKMEDPVFISDVEKLPKLAEFEKKFLKEQLVKSFASFPITTNNKVSGILGFDCVLNRRDWDEKHLSFFRVIADIISDALTRSSLEIELTKNSVTDPLTGLYNRRYMFKRLSEIINEHKRNNKVFSVSIFDIDFFKDFNDSYGHLTGDFIIREFSKILKEGIREYDLLCRYGGEEFLIIFTGISKEKAYDIVERILEKTRNDNFIFENQNYRFTASCGLADSSEIENINSDALINIADQRLLVAKKSGKDKVVGS